MCVCMCVHVHACVISFQIAAESISGLTSRHFHSNLSLGQVGFPVFVPEVGRIPLAGMIAVFCHLLIRWPQVAAWH